MKSLLYNIAHATRSDKWKNTPEPKGERVYLGCFYELESEYCKFRFMPQVGIMKNGELTHCKNIIEQEEQQPVVIAGIAAYYIHFLDLDWDKVCENYYNNCFSNFKNYAHGRIEYDDAELNGTLEVEFLKVHIQHELKCRETTKALFDYIFEDDIKRIENRQERYLKFIDGKLKQFADDHEQPDIKPTNFDGKTYEYNREAMNAAFDFLVENKVLNGEKITLADFLKAVETADFSALRKADGTLKTYLDYSLSILKIFVTQMADWYQAAAASIGKKPKNLTQNKTQNIDDFRKDLNRILKKFVQ